MTTCLPFSRPAFPSSSFAAPPFKQVCVSFNHTITITVRYLYSVPYNTGQRCWTRKKLIELNKKMKWC